MTEPLPKIKRAAQCTRCKANLVLEQDPECPALHIESWLKIIVCNRCGKYLEAYRRVTEAVARVCASIQLAQGSSAMPQVRAAADVKLTTLTQEFDRILTKRWTTTPSWSHEFVEVLMDMPDKCYIAMRNEEGNHRRARERAAREAANKREEQLPI